MSKGKRRNNHNRRNGRNSNRRPRFDRYHRPGSYRANKSKTSLIEHSGGVSLSLTERIKTIKPKHKALRNRFKITPEAFADIVNSVGTEMPESGGILLGSRVDFVVRKYVHDPYGNRNGSAYDPDVNFLNQVVEQAWDEEGLAFLGFVHSHPRGIGQLSGDMGNGIGDLGYISRILEHMPGLESFLCPIVYSTFDGGEFSFFGFIADRGAVRDYYHAPLQICSESILICPPPIPDYQNLIAENDAENDAEIQTDSIEDVEEPELDSELESEEEDQTSVEVGEELEPELDSELESEEEDQTSVEVGEELEPELDCEMESKEEVHPNDEVEGDHEFDDSEELDSSSEDFQKMVFEEIKQRLNDGSLSYEEPPKVVLKPIKHPILKPEDDPSVA